MSSFDVASGATPSSLITPAAGEGNANPSGATLPITRLSRHFALSGDRAAEPFFVVVVGLAQERLGIAVDDLVGQQDIVVKPLGRVLQGVRGISGATDLGNRRTVLVLDVGAIIEDVVSGEAGREAAG